MAINVKEKLGADWAIAISGIAGPTEAVKINLLDLSIFQFQDRIII